MLNLLNERGSEKEVSESLQAFLKNFKRKISQETPSTEEFSSKSVSVERSSNSNDNDDGGGGGEGDEKKDTEVEVLDKETFEDAKEMPSSPETEELPVTVIAHLPEDNSSTDNKDEVDTVAPQPLLAAEEEQETVVVVPDADEQTAAEPVPD